MLRSGTLPCGSGLSPAGLESGPGCGPDPKEWPAAKVVVDRIGLGRRTVARLLEVVGEPLGEVPLAPTEDVLGRALSVTGGFSGAIFPGLSSLMMSRHVASTAVLIRTQPASDRRGKPICVSASRNSSGSCPARSAASSISISLSSATTLTRRRPRCRRGSDAARDGNGWQADCLGPGSTLKGHRRRPRLFEPDGKLAPRITGAHGILERGFGGDLGGRVLCVHAHVFLHAFWGRASGRESVPAQGRVRWRDGLGGEVEGAWNPEEPLGTRDPNPGKPAQVKPWGGSGGVSGGVSGEANRPRTYSRHIPQHYRAISRNISGEADDAARSCPGALSRRSVGQNHGACHSCRRGVSLGVTLSMTLSITLTITLGTAIEREGLVRSGDHDGPRAEALGIIWRNLLDTEREHSVVLELGGMG